MTSKLFACRSWKWKLTINILNFVTYQNMLYWKIKNLNMLYSKLLALTLLCMVVVFQSLGHVWLRNPMDCSTTGLPVFSYLPDPVQTHVHWDSDAIQPSHLLSSPSPPAFNLSQHQGLLYSFPNLKPVLCSMSGSNCCFLTWIKIAQETDEASL